MRFKFPDAADFPENDVAVNPDPGEGPTFYHWRKRFYRDLWDVEEIARKSLLRGGDVSRDHFEPVLRAQISRIEDAYAAFMRLPPTYRKEMHGRGMVTRQAETEGLAKFFRDDIEAVRAIEPARDSIKAIDRVCVRTDDLALQKVQAFLNQHGLMYKACRYRKTVQVRSVAIQVSRPGDRHHYQQFADCQTTTRLLNLHADPKPGVLKAIIYLSEVGEGDGPFQCIPNSMIWSVGLVDRIFAWGNSVGNYCHTPLHRRVACAFPKRFRQNAIVGRLIPDESDLGKTLWHKLETITSDRANVVLFDPCFMLHRGGLCSTGERVNLQVVLK